LAVSFEGKKIFMPKYFNEQKWVEAIKYDDWYLRLSDDYKCLMKQSEESSKEISDEIKEETYQFFENHFEKGDIALGKEGPNWDEERKPIDTVVIHHTKNPPGITWQRLSAMQLIRLYATYYASPYYEKEKHIKGEAIFSNHFKNNHQVFYAYHWLVRMDGNAERLLNDNEIGWQAGNWEVNCRSVAICLDNNFEKSSPPDLVLSSVAKLIKEKYPQVKLENIIGHREVDSKTNCPGNKFLNGWKLKLIENLK
jgi:hypothetical protein